MIKGHSCPLWILGPKSDPFGNTYPGIAKVIDRLTAITELNNDQCGWTSFHTLHEVRSRIKAYADRNNPLAIDLKTLKARLTDVGKKVLAVTVPAFGGADFYQGGAILSDVPSIRNRTRDLIHEGLEMSLELKAEKLGEGVFIWWPACATRLPRLTWKTAGKS